jgi:hypothetical protein
MAVATAVGAEAVTTLCAQPVVTDAIAAIITLSLVPRIKVIFFITRERTELLLKSRRRVYIWVCVFQRH